MHCQSLFILGRQPAIGRAELERLFGAEHVRPVGGHMASDVSPDEVDFDRIGSSIRLAKVLAEISAVQWPAIVDHLAKKLPEYLDYLPHEGKLKLGLSIFGLPVKPNQLLKTGLELKKICKSLGRSVRVVPNSEPALSSAAVLHNQLTSELGLEFLFVRDGNKTWLAQTVRVQDINAYARRDQNRPRRDARVGMLPPKLAQTIVNLATGSLPASEDNVVLDPFCGTGVVLQEALLMGYGAYGTDIEPRMIDYSHENLAWLTTHHGKQVDPTLEVGDATNHRWTHPFTVVACETYLGRPLSSWPDENVLREIIGTCNAIIENFLKNLASQTQPGFRLCLAVPAWHSPNGKIYRLPLIDHLEDIGYNQYRFEHVRDADLVYYRPGQIVGRELLVITRK